MQVRKKRADSWQNSQMLLQNIQCQHDDCLVDSSSKWIKWKNKSLQKSHVIGYLRHVTESTCAQNYLRSALRKSLAACVVYENDSISFSANMSFASTLKYGIPFLVFSVFYYI